MGRLRTLTVIYLFAVGLAQDYDTDTDGDVMTLTTTYVPLEPVLQLRSSTLEVYPSEKVLLQCLIEGISDWNIQWKKDLEDLRSSDLSLSEKGSLLSISAQTSATYTCQGRHRSKDVLTKVSNALEVHIKDLPKPNLQLKSPTLDVYPSEKVKLKCEIEGIADWTILWKKDLEVLHSSELSLTEEGSMLMITARTSETYTCQGRHKSKDVLTDASNSLKVQIKDLPKPNLQLKSPTLEVYPSEKVNLKCEIEGIAEWTILWKKDLEVLRSSELSLTEEGSMLMITAQTSETYTCQGRHKSKDVLTDPSNSLKVQIKDLPKPNLQLKSPTSEVYPSEKVKLKCEIEGIAEWTILWKKDLEVLRSSELSLTEEGSMLMITAQKTATYTCQGRHKTREIFTTISNEREVRVKVTPEPDLRWESPTSDLYPTEKVMLKCRIDGQPDWTILWKKDLKDLPSSDLSLSEEGSVLTITAQTSATYSCQGQHKTRAVSTKMSNEHKVEVQDLPKPTLIKSIEWSEVFEREAVMFTCEFHITGWTYSWFKDGGHLSNDKQTYSITSTRKSDEGSYTCKVNLSSRKLISQPSNAITLQVNDEIAKPQIDTSPTYDKFYTGESIRFSCPVKFSTGWEYQWYHEGKEIPSATLATYSIHYVVNSHTGLYYCKAKRGSFSTELSDKVPLNVTNPPIPTLKNLTTWTDVFHNEAVALSCEVEGSGWTFTWSKDDKNLTPEQSTLSISSATQKDEGTYKCKVHLKSRGVSSKYSNPRYVKVYDSLPVPQLTRNLQYNPLYIGEDVTLSCGISVSSGWRYHWYKDGSLMSNSSETITVNLALPGEGKYFCKASRGENTSTQGSNEIQLNFHEIPVPTLTPMPQWPLLFPGENVQMSCKIKSAMSWTYTWYKNNEMIPPSSKVSMEKDGVAISFMSDTSGNYSCTAELTYRAVRSRSSPEVMLHVHDRKPPTLLRQHPEHSLMHTGDSVSFGCHVNISTGWKYKWFKNDISLKEQGLHYNISSVQTKDSASYKCQAYRQSFTLENSRIAELDIKERPQANIILLTGWSEVFSTDSLKLQCEVMETEDKWNFTWFQKGELVREVSEDTYKVTPQNDPEQSEYTCQGIRNERPLYSKTSGSFKTKNLLLKRRVLLSISGCLFFGIIFIFLGCILLRVFRKPVVAEEKPEENELFLTLQKQKDYTDAPCPLVEFITDAALNAAPKEIDDNGIICSDATVLPIASVEDQGLPNGNSSAKENGSGMTSFQK